MKVVLSEDIPGVGRRGDVKDVPDGYARNYLLRKKLAKIATESILREIREKEKIDKLKEERRMRKAKGMLDKMREIKLKIEVMTTEEGKLFGSVRSSDILKELEKRGFKVENVVLNEPIKEEGRYKVKVILTKDIETEIEVRVIRKEENRDRK